MKLSYLLIAGGFIASLSGGLIWSANHYNSKYLDEQQRADAAESQLRLVNAALADMQTRQRDVAALDAKYTGELEIAKTTIEQLERDVAVGTKRLHLAATCPGVPTASGTASVDDAPRAGLTDAAERNYFILRQRIEIAGKQITGLHDYIRTQCQK